ncbi:MAG TPA: hypothetical protein VJA21_04030 [Verrucomicrobiae bacterium]
MHIGRCRCNVVSDQRTQRIFLDQCGIFSRRDQAGGSQLRRQSQRDDFHANDTDPEVLWLIIGAPEELEFLQGSKSKMIRSSPRP